MFHNVIINWCEFYLIAQVLLCNVQVKSSEDHENNNKLSIPTIVNILVLPFLCPHTTRTFIIQCEYLHLNCCWRTSYKRIVRINNDVEDMLCTVVSFFTNCTKTFSKRIFKHILFTHICITYLHFLCFSISRYKSIIYSSRLLFRTQK